MKKNLLFLVMFLFTMSVGLLFAQTTELFETETDGSTSFTDNSQVFNITTTAGGPFSVQGSFPGVGFNGTTGDNVFIDNDPYAAGNVAVSFKIETSGDIPFIVNNFWIYMGDNFANIDYPNGALTLVGKLGGATVFNVTQTNGFNRNPGVNNGFTQINMSSYNGQNIANIPIDELTLSTNNVYNYVALDAFNWTVTAPEINVKGNSVSIVDGDASPTATDHSDFSSQSVCSGTIVRTYTIENTGTRYLNITSANLSGTHASDYSVTSSPASTVAAGSSTTMQVTFNPSAAGTRTATLTINNSDANEGAYDFAIQGTGHDPEVNVQGNSTSIADGDATPTTTDHTDFGSQSVCSGTITRTFTIQNTGTSNLTLGTVTIGGTHSGDFSVTATPSSPVSAAGSTTFQVTFNPNGTGVRSADISFSTNDCDEGTYNFNIQGTGVDPEVNVQGNSTSITDGDASPGTTDHTDFGSQSVCSGTITRTFTVQNTGTSNLTLGTVTIGGTNAGDFSVTATPSSPVSAAGSTTFQVTFDPTASGTRSATISFSTNDCDEGTYDFSIQGTGTDDTPNADDPSDVTACDSYTLPALTVGNYFSGTGGTGTAYSAGNVISSSMTLYVYAVNGSCSDENSFNITINTTPVADSPSDVTACDSYTLPALTVGNYFSGTGGTGTAYSAGNVISSSMTMYVYAETGTTPNCSDENSFDITINTTPVADSPSDVTACDSYTLPALTVGNYFSGSGGTGTAYSAGNVITSSMTMYVYTETGTTPNCSDENSFDITINNTPIADAPADVTACDSYTLPALTVGNYFSGTGGTGTAYSAGNVISSSMTMYVYAETGTTPNCSDENSFDITINNSPVADNPSDVTACDSYTLPALTVGNYFSGPGGTGTAYSAGNVISSSMTMYVYAETGTSPNCTSENSFDITINAIPIADDPSDVTVCNSYTLPALTVGNYFSGTGGTGTAYSAGNVISSSMTMYVYAETGTSPNCTSENSFEITIDVIPTVATTTDNDRCGTGTVSLQATASIGSIEWFIASSSGSSIGSGSPFTTPSISATTTYYAEAVNGTCVSASRSAVIATVVPTTQIRSYDCGRTSMDFSEKIYCDVVAGATDYRFEVFDGTNTYEIDRTARYFYLSMIPGNDYNKTYTIRVKPKVSGSWGCYSTSCNVMTARPRTKVPAAQCGVTLATIDARIFAETRPDATGYRFKVYRNGANVQTIDKTENAFRLTELPSYNYNTTYTVYVAYEADGIWGLYGAGCDVTTPAVPTTQVQASQCGTTLATTTAADKIYANNVYLATDYRFEVTYGGNTQVIDRTARYFFITQYSGWEHSRTYSVRVAAKVNGSWGTYGPACNITTPASGMMQDENIYELEEGLIEDISLEAYPNPNSGDFTVSATHAGQFNLINELGQVVQRMELNEENNFKIRVEGLDNGVYFVTGTISSTVITRKVIVNK